MDGQSFTHYNLSKEILEALNLLNYKEATKVQQLVLPKALSKKDLRVKASTGSGKTAAFGIPISEMVDWLENKPQALILVPTRELAIQVSEEIRSIGRLKRLKVSAIFGRVDIKRQELELKQKTHIVVGTPGRIRDLISRGSLVIDEIKYLVIDEADEMFFIGLKEQVEDIIKQLPKSRTTMLFSATLSEDINELVKQYMIEPLDIEVESETTTMDQIKQLAFLVEEEQKFDALKYVTITQNPDSCIIFANTQVKVDEIYEFLKKNKYPVNCLHGGLQQKERMKIMESFKQGGFRYLVATDVVARGIDIDKLSLVINFDMYRGLENYVHRIGRTGRQREIGTAVTFYTKNEKSKLEELENYLKTSILQVPTENKSTNIELTKIESDDIESTEIKSTDIESTDIESAAYLPSDSSDSIIKRIENETFIISSNEQLRFEEKLKQTPVVKPNKSKNVEKDILKLHINAGKKAKIRTNEIVATICSIEGILDTDIGVIQITDIATFVEILNNKGLHVLEELKKKTIKGKVRKVNIARR